MCIQKQISFHFIFLSLVGRSLRNSHDEFKLFMELLFFLSIKCTRLKDEAQHFYCRENGLLHE